MNAAPESSGGRALAWGRLLRLSLFPSAVADAGLGLLIGCGGWPGDVRAAIAPLAALCVYHGGMALNDWADAERDARDNPGRPIPAGLISRGAALWVALLLLCAGPLAGLAIGTGPALAYAATAACAAGYDLVGRGPRLGPLLLGAARVANVASAACVGAVLSGTELLVSPRFGVLHPAAYVALLACALGLYGHYVLRVSKLALLEDLPRVGNLAAVRPVFERALPLRGALAGLLISGMIGAPLLWRGALASGLGFAAGLALELRSARDLRARLPDPDARAAGGEAPCDGGSDQGVAVQPLVGGLLRRLLLFDAAACLASGLFAGWLMAGLILLGLPIAARLKRVFPPT